jgi:glutathione synthase/RimK-type ligase-like ATP-grasp enzyme
MVLDTAALFDLARRLTEKGAREEAKETYLTLLKQSPDHFGALNNLGALLHEMGYRSAARTAYARAVERHPQNPMGHVNLANAMRDGGDIAAAREHCQIALSLDPSHAGAHQAIASILFDLGDHVAAARHRKLGYENQPPLVLPCRGTGKSISLLLLVSAIGGNVPIRHLIDDKIFATAVIYADYWATPLPPHDLVFNTIGDADLCRPAIEAAAHLLAKNRKPVLNAPDHVLPTGRTQNAARLAHLPGVRAARTIDLPREIFLASDAAETLAGRGLKFPLLLRSPGFHTGQHFERIETSEQLRDAAARLPGETLTAIEYLDARGPDGKARKYRAMFVDGAILPLHLCISDDWKVHYFTSAMAESAAFRAEEERFLHDMPGVIGARGMAGLAAIQRALGLDYGGIDFAVGRDGEILLFEANATMIIIAPGPDPRWDYRRAAIAQVEDAVRAMLLQRAIARPSRAA